jgi:hypothetical protein
VTSARFYQLSELLFEASDYLAGPKRRCGAEPPPGWSASRCARQSGSCQRTGGTTSARAPRARSLMKASVVPGQLPRLNRPAPCWRTCAGAKSVSPWKPIPTATETKETVRLGEATDQLSPRLEPVPGRCAIKWSTNAATARSSTSVRAVEAKRKARGSARPLSGVPYPATCISRG